MLWSITFNLNSSGVSKHSFTLYGRMVPITYTYLYEPERTEFYGDQCDSWSRYVGLGREGVSRLNYDHFFKLSVKGFNYRGSSFSWGLASEAVLIHEAEC